MVPIIRLKPDPKQPRQEHKQESAEGMAASIKSEGIINAIEIDKDFRIITGEIRWHAAKLAGLTEVPVKIIENIEPNERFIRQMQENIHHNTMSAWDTAVGLKHVKDILTSSAAELVRDKKHKGEHFQKGISEVSKLFGMKVSSVEEYLSLLQETGEVKKALKNPKFKWTKIVEAKRAPEEYQKKIKEMIVKQPKMSRDAVRHLSKAITMANDYGEKDKIEEVLKENLEGLSALAAAQKIDTIIPGEETRIQDPKMRAKKIGMVSRELIYLLEDNPPEAFDPIHRNQVLLDLKFVAETIAEYVKKSKIKQPKLLN